MSLLSILKGAVTGNMGLRRQFHAIAQQTGLELLDVEADSALFHVPYDGKSYGVSVFVADDTVMIRVRSKAEWPPGRLPPAVVEAVMQRNQELDRYAWDTAHTPRFSRFALDTYLTVREFDVARFQIAVEDMVPEVADFDRALVERGYAR